ncbi:hypothetical protein U1Q18_008198 [Sarracenia purpurea var. burkii]
MVFSFCEDWVFIPLEANIFRRKLQAQGNGEKAADFNGFSSEKGAGRSARKRRRSKRWIWPEFQAILEEFFQRFGKKKIPSSGDWQHVSDDFGAASKED